MDKELKIKYNNDFLKIRFLVNRFDPCKLIEAGALEDEYDSLTNKILSGLYNKIPRDEIRKGILHEIEYNFGIPILSEMEQYDRTKFSDDLETLLDNAITELRS